MKILINRALNKTAILLLSILAISSFPVVSRAQSVDVLFAENLADLKKYHKIDYEIKLLKNEIWEGIAYSSFSYSRQRCDVFFDNMEKESTIVRNPPLQNTSIKRHIIYHELMHCIFSHYDMRYFFGGGDLANRYFSDLLMLESLYESNSIHNNRLLFDEIASDVYATAYMIRTGMDRDSLDIILRWRRLNRDSDINHDTYDAIVELTNYDITKMDIESLHKFLNYLIIKNFFKVVQAKKSDQINPQYYQSLTARLYSDWQTINNKMKNNVTLTEFEKVFIVNLNAKIFINPRKKEYPMWDVLSSGLNEKDYASFIIFLLNNRYKLNLTDFLKLNFK